MKYIQILETTCSTDVSSCCSDYGIAMYLYIMKNALTIIQIAIPILLLVMATIQMIKMMASPDDKKSPKALLNKFIAALVVFFIPLIVNVVLSIIPDSFELSACWKSAEGIAKTMNSKVQYDVVKADKKKKKVIDISKYKISDSDLEKLKKSTEESENNNNNSNNSNNSTEDVGTTTSVTSASNGQKIVDYALNFVGNPYVSGGTSLTSGCDCSGFVYSILKDLKLYNGNRIVSDDWANQGKKVKGGLKNAQAGDVVVYSGHVGIYDGKGKLVEAKGRKWGITNDRSPKKVKHKFLGVRRFV